MCGFVGVDFDRRMLEFHRSDASTRDYRKFPQNIEATRPISLSSVGRHRTVLTADEIALVEERAAARMQRLGYAPAQGPRAGRPRRAALDAPPHDRVRVVDAGRVHELIAVDPGRVKRWTFEALRAHHEGAFIQPPKSYLVTTENPYDRIISLPAAVLSPEPALGVKWIGSHSRNHERGHERAQALIILNDPETHAARVVMDGTLISSMRTLAVSLIAMDQFAPRPARVGVLGMGKLGRMHAQLLGDLYPSIEEINCFSRRAPVDDLLADPRVRKRASAREVLDRSEVVVTTSAATEPYILENHLRRDCRLIVNLSLMDCHVDVIKNSDHIVVDDWLQNSRAERVFKTGVDQGLYGRERVSELSEVLFGPRRNYPGRVFVNPLGMGLERFARRSAGPSRP
jgi:N-[(2S)-2-amino-2-carboxyethyl]-L-glutamate dehydrogenase